MQLVETVKVETLVEDLKKTGYKSSHDIRRDSKPDANSSLIDLADMSRSDF